MLGLLNILQDLSVHVWEGSQGPGMEFHLAVAEVHFLRLESRSKPLCGATGASLTLRAPRNASLGTL